MASGMNEEKVNKEQYEERYNPRPLILLAVFLAILGFFFFISHRYFSLAKPIDGAVWGEFGDFIGGVIGTIIAYISSIIQKIVILFTFYTFVPIFA